MRIYRPRVVVALLLLGLIALCHILFVWHDPAPVANAQDAVPEPKKDAADEKTIRMLIQQLGDISFEKREAAAKRLAEIGEPALIPLENAAQKDSDPEVRTRATELGRVIDKSSLQEVRRFDGHKRDKYPIATRVAVSPDGKHIVTAGGEMLRYWELESGKEVAAFGPVAQSGYYGLSISKDGKRVIAGGGLNVVRVFELPSGKFVQQFAGHSGLIMGAFLLDGGKQAVSVGMDKLIRVWDIGTGKEVRTFDNIDASTRGAALSPDGKVLATAQCRVLDNSPGVARLWDIETGKVIRTLEGHRMNTTSVDFSPDGSMVLASGYDGEIRIWDVKSGKELKVFKGGPQGIAQAVFTGNARRVIAAGQRQIQTVRVWDIASGNMLFESDRLGRQGDGVYGVAALADPQRFLSASTDGFVRLWRLKR
jgi:WD40 repeat protein